MAEDDERTAAEYPGRRFSNSSRPVIRWVKGDGLDDAVTRAAIGQATRLFGSAVDYCLCTKGIDAPRARTILEWANQPIEWWPVSDRENPQLERIRPNAPEWILDGNIVITSKPPWFDGWIRGIDPLRVTHDDSGANPHFERLTAEHVIFSKSDIGLLDRFRWLGGRSQWGVPGWSMPDDCAQVILECAEAFAGRPTLELGTSRGRITAMLATLGCQVTTVDHQDRGAAQNLKGLPVRVIQDDVVRFLSQTMETFDLIVVDLHGNSQADWQRYAKPLLSRLDRAGTLLLNNATLYNFPDWRDETGVRWFLDQLTQEWTVELRTQTPPGIAIVTNANVKVGCPIR
ncbi:MAG: class I SAM-dependent methyltransferase [Candidatus Saganbacteria bacterium]|nr:class I SAM-dependent methyltransferase [Candidatus Saganbacteria bacterium]